MRGIERIRTIVVFLGSAMASASVVGFLLGAALGWLPDPTMTFAAVVVLAATVADVGWRVAGNQRRKWLTPIRIDGQVPREWGRLFSAPVVAFLYGSRLAIGPLTLLPTWLWWAGAALAAATDPARSAAFGATFAMVRMMTIVITSLAYERSTEHRPLLPGFGRRVPQVLISGLCALVIVLVLSASLTACGTSESVSVGPTTPPVPTSARPAGPDAASSDTTSPESPSPETQSSTVPSTADPDPTVNPGSFHDPDARPDSAPPPKSSTDPAGPTLTGLPATNGPTAAAGPATAPSSPQELAALLLETVPGFNPVAAAGADVALDLGQAAIRQPDPMAERALLETRGFLGGWTRAFRNDTQDVVLTTVYEFESAAAADFYLEDGLITVGGYGGQLFDVDGHPLLHGFRQESADAGGPLIAHGLTFTSANRWYLVFVLGDPQTATVDIAIEAATRQMARVIAE